jgi:hypothetical protein
MLLHAYLYVLMVNTPQMDSVLFVGRLAKHAVVRLSVSHVPKVWSYKEVSVNNNAIADSMRMRMLIFANLVSALVQLAKDLQLVCALVAMMDILLVELKTQPVCQDA